MTRDQARAISIGVFIGIALLFVVWELVCLVLPGVPTLSGMLLDANEANNWVGLGVAFFLGGLLVHLFVPLRQKR